MAENDMRGFFPPADLDLEKRWLTTGFEKPVDPQELEDAIHRLTMMVEYTLHQTRKKDHRGSHLRAQRWRDENERLLNTIVAGVYEHLPDYERIVNGYEGDKDTLKQYMGHEAIKLVPKIIKQRERIVRKLEDYYSDDDKVTSLADAISVILPFRTGLPFFQIAGTTSEHNYAEITSETKAYLEPSPNPKTRETLDPYYSWTLNNPYWHDWSPFVGDRDEHGSPFNERFKALEIPYKTTYVPTLRTQIYKSHPMTILVDKLYKYPYELADIIRISDPQQRNQKLRDDYLGRIKKVVKEANAEVEYDFTIDWNNNYAWHYKYNWHKYQPLLLTVSHDLHKGENDAIIFLVTNFLISEMMNNTPLGMLDNALTAASLLSLLGGVVGRSIGTAAVWAARALAGLTVVGGVSVATYKLYDAAVTAPNSQSREDILAGLDKDIVLYENNTSVLAAAGLLFIEVITSGLPTRAFKAKAPVTPKPDIPVTTTPKTTSPVTVRGTGGNASSLDDALTPANNNTWTGMGSADPLDLQVAKKPVAGVQDDLLKKRTAGISDAEKMAAKTEAGSSAATKVVDEPDLTKAPAPKPATIPARERALQSLEDKPPSWDRRPLKHKEPPTPEELELEKLLNPMPQAETTALVPIKDVKTMEDLFPPPTTVQKEVANDAAADVVQAETTALVPIKDVKTLEEIVAPERAAAKQATTPEISYDVYRDIMNPNRQIYPELSPSLLDDIPGVTDNVARSLDDVAEELADDMIHVEYDMNVSTSPLVTRNVTRNAASYNRVFTAELQVLDSGIVYNGHRSHIIRYRLRFNEFTAAERATITERVRAMNEYMDYIIDHFEFPLRLRDPAQGHVGTNPGRLVTPEMQAARRTANGASDAVDVDELWARNLFEGLDDASTGRTEIEAVNQMELPRWINGLFGQLDTNLRDMVLQAGPDGYDTLVQAAEVEFY